MEKEKKLFIIFKNGLDHRAVGMFTAESAEKFLKENNFQEVSKNRYEMKISDERSILASIMDIEFIFPFFRGNDNCEEDVIPCPS